MESERILNFVLVKKARTCSYLQKSIYYNQSGALGFCCMKQGPEVEPSENVDAKAYQELRNTLLQKLENSQELTYMPCDGCPQICEQYCPEKPLSWSINYFCYGHCNYRCVYCNVWDHKVEPLQKGEQPLGVLIQKFKEMGTMNPDYITIFSTAGEPTIHPNRKELYDSFDGAEFVVNTNGYIFDADLFEAMQTKRIFVNCSVDAGMKETYAKIKGVDGFEQVRRNLKQYAQATTGIVALKYIIVVNPFQST